MQVYILHKIFWLLKYSVVSHRLYIELFSHPEIIIFQQICAKLTTRCTGGEFSEQTSGKDTSMFGVMGGGHLTDDYVVDTGKNLRHRAKEGKILSSPGVIGLQTAGQLRPDSTVSLLIHLKLGPMHHYMIYFHLLDLQKQYHKALKIIYCSFVTKVSLNKISY